MKKNIILPIFILVCTAISAHSQTVSDAVRYSYNTYANSGRSAGVNNSLGAMGTDFGAISQNPGGLGWYRTSEFNFSLGTTGYTTNAQLSGTNNKSTKITARKFGIPGVGLVFNSKPRHSDWKNVNFALGINQLGAYKQEYQYEGVSKGSVMDYFVEQAQGKTADQLDPFSTKLAYEAFAIYDPDETNGNKTEWASDFDGFATKPVVAKKQEVLNTGYASEVVMALGANYKEKLSVGASLGVPFMRYETQSFYSEDNSGPDKVSFFNSLEWTEDVRAKGVGVNLKIGASYRPIQALRIGAAIHSPTAYAISEDYNNSFVYDLTTANGTNYRTSKSSPDGQYDYNLLTPWRWIGDAGIIIGKKGFISAEVEYVDYPTARFTFNNTSDDPDATKYQRELNNKISKELEAGFNYRIGAEYVLGDFRVRAGYGIYATPYANDSQTNSSFSLGFGARLEKFFFDLGYVNWQQKQSFKPYEVSVKDYQPLVNSELSSSRILLTVGFKF